MTDPTPNCCRRRWHGPNGDAVGSGDGWHDCWRTLDHDGVCECCCRATAAREGTR